MTTTRKFIAVAEAFFAITGASAKKYAAARALALMPVGAGSSSLLSHL